jgi:hypothetical protein
MYKTTTTVVFILALLCNTFSQCTNYIKNHHSIRPSFSDYKQKEESLNIKMSYGEINYINLSFKENKDYRITIYCDSIFDNIIELAIYKQNTELYNNMFFKYKKEVEFSNKKNFNGVLKISTPSQTSDNNTSGCVGILIEEADTPTMGF